MRPKIKKPLVLGLELGFLKKACKPENALVIDMHLFSCFKQLWIFSCIFTDFFRFKVPKSF